MCYLSFYQCIVTPFPRALSLANFGPVSDNGALLRCGRGQESGGQAEQTVCVFSGYVVCRVS